MNGAELLVQELSHRGVEFISTLCGHGLNPLYAACQAKGIRLVDTRNEQAAAYLAEAYGRLSRRVGVCAVSSGVAHVNALTGVANAHLDGAPMLLLTGSGATSTVRSGAFPGFGPGGDCRSPVQICQRRHGAGKDSPTGRAGICGGHHRSARSRSPHTAVGCANCGGQPPERNPLTSPDRQCGTDRLR